MQLIFEVFKIIWFQKGLKLVKVDSKNIPIIVEAHRKVIEMES